MCKLFFRFLGFPLFLRKEIDISSVKIELQWYLHVVFVTEHFLCAQTRTKLLCAHGLICNVTYTCTSNLERSAFTIQLVVEKTVETPLGEIVHCKSSVCVERTTGHSRHSRVFAMLCGALLGPGSISVLYQVSRS